MSGSFTPGLVVTFNYAEWLALFPEFATISQAQATLYFNLATQYLDNSPFSPVLDGSAGGQRDTYLNLLTAHIAALLGGVGGAAASSTVGRLESASEGSVSVSFSMPDATNPTAAFFEQTKYGLIYWTMTAQYRRGGVYRPGIQPFFTPGGQVYGCGPQITYPFLTNGN